MNKVIFLCAAILGLLANNAAAQVEVLEDTQSELLLEVTDVFVLGDNDTLIDARNISIEQAKKSASDFAGTYVEQSLVVTGDNLSQHHIRVLTAGYLEVLNTTEQKRLNDNGHISLTTTSTIRLPKDSVKNGITRLRSDSSSLDSLKRLEEDNQQLRAELARVSALLESSSLHGPENHSGLSERRGELLVKLERQRSLVRHFFEQGDLLRKARSDDMAFEIARFRFEDEVLEHFKRNTEISLSEPEFTDNGNGTYNMRVFIAWDTPIEETKPFWQSYFNILEPNPMNEFTLYLTDTNNSKNKQRNAFTQALYKDVKSKALIIRVTAGTYSAEIPVSAVVDAFDYFRPESGNIYKLQYKADRNTDAFVHYGIHNPVTFEAIPSAELSQLTRVTADIVIKSVSN